MGHKRPRPSFETPRKRAASQDDGGKCGWPLTCPVASLDNIDQMASETKEITGATMENGIFEGLKVLDCASFIAAPAAATVLSDFGADVIKIEPPGPGDPYRNLSNLPGYPVSP